MSNTNPVTLEQMNNEVPESETQHSSRPTSAKPMLAAVPMRAFDVKIVELEETCQFCGVEKITSGTWLQFGTVGTPCCWSCFVKA